MDVTVYDYYKELRRYFKEVEDEREKDDESFFLEDVDEYIAYMRRFEKVEGFQENIVDNCKLKYDSSFFLEDSVIYHVRAQHKDYLEFFNHCYHMNRDRGIHEFRILQLTSSVVIKMLESSNSFKGLNDFEQSSIRSKIRNDDREKYIIEYRSPVDSVSTMWEISFWDEEPYLAENNDIEDISLFWTTDNFVFAPSYNIFTDKSEALNVVCKNIHRDWLVEEIKPFSINNGVKWSMTSKESSLF